MSDSDHDELVFEFEKDDHIRKTSDFRKSRTMKIRRTGFGTRLDPIEGLSESLNES